MALNKKLNLQTHKPSRFKFFRFQNKYPEKVKIYHSIADFSHPDIETAVSIGSFDGVHLGHRKILTRLKEIAGKNNRKTLVISFSPHPRIYFNPDTELKLLTTDEEKKQLLQEQGIDFLILQDFNAGFAGQDPEEFIEKLVNKLHMKDFLFGYDHHFGKNRSGDFDFVKSLENKYHFKTHRIDAFLKDGQEISSTLIRNLLQEGKVKQAAGYLGYPYFITGKVVKGNQLGRKLGFPTANISIENPYKLVPKQGVYLVRSVIDNQPVYGMMNIGFRPTIDGKEQIKEVHFFDFGKDLYDQKIQVSFLERMRDEQKFPSLEALKEQLKKDEIYARSLISEMS